MEQIHDEPQAPDPQPPASIEIFDAPATSALLETSFEGTRRLRHDGWDGPKTALFCQVLAETGIVADACVAVRMSAKSAYALRHRNSLFAAAWEAALVRARARLADDLLARSLQGSQELITRNGAIVGERHHFDNKLAFAVLRRLDRRAEYGATFRTPPRRDVAITAPALAGDWEPLLEALAEDRAEDANRLLTPVPDLGKGNEGNDPLLASFDELDSVPRPFVPKRVWEDWLTGEWRTSFPPPDDFDGEESGDWEEGNYWRTLTAEELQAMVAGGLAEGDPDDPEEFITLEEDCAERDSFFAGLREGQAVSEA